MLNVFCIVVILLPQILLSFFWFNFVSVKIADSHWQLISINFSEITLGNQFQTKGTLLIIKIRNGYSCTRFEEKMKYLRLEVILM
jgi:hypothetical protein